MLDIITVGSNSLDIFAHTDKGSLINIKRDGGSEEFISYPVGSKLLLTKLMHNFGGNGTNAAVALSRLGLKVGYIGKVGKDDTGDRILSSLKKNKVAFLGARGDESGTSIILDAMGEDRTILTFKGCNNELKLRELKLSKAKSKWLYISSMLGESLETMRKLASKAKTTGTKISFNPSQTILEKAPEIAKELAMLSDILVLNKEEAALLVGQGSVEENLKKIASLGPAIAVITDGKNGAVAIDAVNSEFYRVTPAKSLNIVETTGSGDAFAATLTGMIILCKPLDFALRAAINQAENVIQGHGAQNHLAPKAELLKQIAKDRRAVDRHRV